MGEVPLLNAGKAAINNKLNAAADSMQTTYAVAEKK